jgi:hypothetical protein
MNKLDKLYFSALKGAAKKARSESGGGRIPSEKRWGVLHAAEEKISRRAWPIHETYDKEIIDAMAKLAWASAWADREEEKGRGSKFSGRDIYDLVPQTPPAARKWARNVARELLSLNKVPSLTNLYEIAVNKWGYPSSPDRFGSDLAHGAVGSGVSWMDDIMGHTPDDAIVIPHSEFYL